MDSFDFELKSGVETVGYESSCKFMAFHLLHGKEISFFEAKKQNIVTRPTVSVRTSNPKNLYSVEIPIIKIFLAELDFGRQRTTYSFYLSMEPLEIPQTVTIKPISKAGVKADFYFKAQAKFLSKKDTIPLLDPDSMSYKMLLAQSPLPIDTLRSLVSITRPKVIEQARKVRKLRFG